jgi:hypothetical protein
MPAASVFPAFAFTRARSIEVKLRSGFLPGPRSGRREAALRGEKK